MTSTWDILKKELAYNGIILLDNDRCQFIHNNKKYVCSLRKKTCIIKNSIKHNNLLFDSLWKELTNLLSEEEQSLCTTDIRIVNIFVDSIKELYMLAWMIADYSFEFRSKLIGSKTFKVLRGVLARDYVSFSKEQVDAICDYKICIDWTIRKNCALSYVIDLLSFASMGREFVSGKTIKTARGISGPWANLDLPKLERQLPWSDISDEVRGRTHDKQDQTRYRKGFDAYNQPGVGEGHYWREIKNEPFSWYDRDTEDPYPSRHTLSR